MAKRQIESTEHAPQSTALTTGTTILSVPADWLQYPLKKSVVSTYDTSTQAGRRALFSVLNEDQLEAEFYINTVVTVQHVVIYPVKMHDRETGDPFLAIRTVMVSPDGSSIGFVAESVLQFFERLTSMGLPGPWDPPLRLLLRQKQTKTGRRMYQLIEQE